MASSPRSSLLRAFTSIYVFGYIPSLNLLIFVILFIGLGYIVLHFDQQYTTKPVLTTMVTNSMLNGIADTVAQTITIVTQRSTRQRIVKKDSPSIDLSEKNQLPTHLGQPFASSGSSFDLERLVRFMAWGLIMAPAQLKWFEVLSDLFPITEDSKTLPAIWRVLLDQTVFGPMSLALFFVYMTVAEGGGRRAAMRKLNTVFKPALKSNFIVWPAVQILNFRVIPLQLQLPFASTVGIFWTAYLSLQNDAVDT